MKIASANVNMYSESTFQYAHSTTTDLRIHFGQNNTNQEEQSNNLQTNAFFLDFNYSQTTTISASRVIYDFEDNMSLEDRIKKLLIEKLLGRLYGDKSTIDMYPKAKAVSINYIQQNPYTQTNPYTQQNNGTQQNSFGMLYKQTEEYYQKQTVDFSASLQINTPNKSFSIDLSISYSKELYESHSTRIAIGDQAFLDPLVINFDEDVNPFENLSELKFEFDLNNDGQEDLIPKLKQGAGYLALDKNNNGSIDNGSELFGTESGNGFKDLAKYDDDNNNWIDENDAIFNKLKIWQQDEMGNNKLVSLVDLNVGAIYLGDVQSGFQYQSSINNTDAIQKSNGIFLKEDGTGAGMINSIDIAI